MGNILQKCALASTAVIVLVLSVFMILPAAGYAWTIQGIDTPKKSFLPSSKGSSAVQKAIAIDRNSGTRHVVYGNDHLYHAYFDGSQWVKETVDGSPDAGADASLAVDSNGKLHIAYYDQANMTLKYATNALGLWETIIIDTNGGWNCAIALDSNDKVHISYIANNAGGGVRYITNASGVWITSVIDMTSGETDFDTNTSIAVDSTNHIHISYSPHYGGVWYASNSSGSWASQQVATSGEYTASIALDSNDKAYICYLGGATAPVNFVTNVSGSWAATTVDVSVTASLNCSIAVDSARHVHLSYYDSTNKNLKYATNASGSWLLTNVDTVGDVGAYSSMALDSADKVHIRYYDSTNGALKYAGNASGSWSRATVDRIGDVGAQSSIAVDSANKAHVAYYDTRNGDLKYAANSSGGWVLTAVDSSGNVGQYPSIKADASGKAHVSYYDATNGNLKYATNSSGAWVATTVDGNTWDTAGQTSLALDSNGKAHISYYDSTNHDLGYVTNVSGSWVTSWLDTAGDVGMYSSIAVDSANKAHISYHDTTNGRLKYATNSTGAWMLRTVDNNAGGTYSDITVDSSGNAYISYYSSYATGKMYARCSSTSCSPNTIYDGTVTTAVGGNTSIAMNAIGDIHVTYYDSISKRLAYSKNPTAFTGYVAIIPDTNQIGPTTSMALDSVGKLHISYYDVTESALKYLTTAVIDITPPTGTVSINNGATLTNSVVVTLQLTCADLQGACSQVQFSNNNVLWSTADAYAPGKSWTLATGDGLKVVYARFSDAAGNWSAPVTASITLDATLPSGSVSISGAPLVNSAAVTLVLSCSDDSGSGCALMQFSNDNVSWSPSVAYVAAASWNLTDIAYGGNPANGTKTVYARYRDMAGNLSPTVSGNITLDTDQPAGSILSFQGVTTYTTSANVTLNLSCSDATTTCTQMRFSNNGLSWSVAASYATSAAWNLNNATYGGTAADGSKTVYSQFKDAAGNWSTAVIGKSIILDTVSPSGTVQVNANAASTTSPAVSLAVTCSDATSGCGQMRFSNDNASWSAPIAFATTTTWNLVAGYGGTATDGNKPVYAQFRDTAGGAWSSSVSDVIFLDNHVPTTTASPGGGSNVSAVAVSLNCIDGAGSGCADTYYTLDGTPPGTSSSKYTGGPINISGITSPVLLKFFSVDSLGNAESVKTETYSFVAGYSSLTLDLASPTLLQNGLLDVSGKLTRYPDSAALPNNGMDLSGLPLVLTVTGPPGSPCAGGCVENATTYSPLGHYRFQGLDRFSFKGNYILKVHFDGTGLHQASDSGSESLLVGASAGYAIIVEGKVNTGEGLESHNKTTGRIYEALKERGFVDDNIMYFNYLGSGVPGVDAVPTKSAIQAAIQSWALGRMNGAPAPLYLIMVDHGTSNTFHVYPDTLSSAELNNWLGSLEANLSPTAKMEKRIILLGMCYSGSFIGQLKQASVPGVNAGRIVITSAAADEQSYKGPNEPDGIRGGEFFMEELFKQLRKGASFKTAFAEASALTGTFTSQGSASGNSNNGYGDNSVQHPLLEDDGIGQGSNTLVDGIGDGIESSLMHLGFGVTNASLGPADLKEVASTHFLAASATTTPAPLWSEAYSNAAVSSAWFEVKAPNTLLAGTGGSGQLSLDIPKILMELKGTGKWEPVSGSNPTFIAPGKYEVYYFTKSTNAEISEMKRSLVYKNSAGNLQPAAFSLISPVNGVSVRTELNLVWQASADPDGLTYTVQIASDPGFAPDKIVYQKEEIENNWYYIDGSAALKDKANYYWRILAVDRFGSIRISNQQWTFQTDNTNSLPGWIKGTVSDTAANKVPGATVDIISGATLIARVNTIEGGVYLAVVPPGTYTVSAHSGNYAKLTEATVNLGSGDVQITDLTVIDSVKPVITGFTIPVTSTSAIITIGSVTATDNIAVTGYCVIEQNDSSKCPNPFVVAPLQYIFSGITPGVATPRTLYVFARDAAGNISDTTSSSTASVTITLPVQDRVLQVSVIGTGRVYQSPSGIDCIGTPPAVGCGVTWPLGTHIDLVADPNNWRYLFDSWGGVACGGGNGATLCGFALNADMTVTATFVPNYQARVGVTYYTSLQDALSAASSGATVEAQVYTFQESILLNRIDNAVLTVNGGLGAGYSYPAVGATTVAGSVIVQKGTLCIKGPLAVR